MVRVQWVFSFSVFVFPVAFIEPSELCNRGFVEIFDFIFFRGHRGTYQALLFLNLIGILLFAVAFIPRFALLNELLFLPLFLQFQLGFWVKLVDCLSDCLDEFLEKTKLGMKFRLKYLP